MHTILQDLRYALRQLRQSPGFTLAAVLTLSIGIGANTAIFSMMDALVLRPLDVPDLAHVVAVGEQQKGGETHPVSTGTYQDWKLQSRSFDQLAAWRESPMSLTGAGDAAHVMAVAVSANFFSVLQVKTLLGRVFQPNECVPGQEGVAMLSYAFWQKQYASDPAVVGRKVELDQHTYTIVGVMPKSLQYPSLADLFLPLAPNPQQLANRSDHSLRVIGRLRPGVTAAQAQNEMHIVAARLAQAYPATNLGWSVRVEPIVDVVNGDKNALYFNLVMGATLFVLLVVCANVANLQFARGIARRPEMAMRTALGAGRVRLLRQLLTESILLGLVGAAGGLVLARMDLHLAAISMPERVARELAGWQNIALNGRVLVFSLLLAVAAGVVAGVAPALEALRVNVVEQLKSGSRAVTGAGRSRILRNVFAVSQIALAVALVIGAALMAKGMYSLLHFADPFAPKQILTFQIHLPEARYDTPQKKADWYKSSLDKLRALPGVKNAEITTMLPYGDGWGPDDFRIENRPLIPGKFQSAIPVWVSNGYFQAMRLPILSGRGFGAGDALGTEPTALVSRSFVEHYFSGENPLGRRIQMGPPSDKAPWVRIVGVATDASYQWIEQTPRPAVYLNLQQMPPLGAKYTVVTDGNPLALAPAARKALAGIDPTLPLDAVMTYEQFLNESLTGLLYAAAMLTVDAMIALLLAAIGIFAVMANLVAERTREIGVRLAMGARREDVLMMIIRRAAWLTGTGVATGLAMAFVLAHAVASLLYGVSPNDPMVFGGITAAIIAIALLASFSPARRASRIEPMAALRDE